jgi:DNA-binding NtrC family response regulator
VSFARILVADDDPALLDSVGDALARMGADVTRASDGAELIENLADKGPFDLIVTDVAMPWMTGVQAIHATRSAGLGTSVIIMTALSDEAISGRVSALGENVAFLRKPFGLGELESMVSRLLAQRSRETA